jgi:predicted transposase YdaD
MTANREYKDSLFSFLFSNPEVLRKLYGALEDVRLDPDVPITVNTLSDVLFKEQINDLSFLVDNRLVVLIEHQSTVNPNMALRLFLYLARIYEKIFDRKKLYSSKPLQAPRPECIVLYNGAAPYPDRITLNLSELFAEAGKIPGAAALPALELSVKVYNINSGHNRDIVEKCRELEWYSAFTARVREYKAQTGNNEKAMKMAINYCIEHNILRDFLETHASEVMNMLLSEWNTEEWGAVQREEGREEGWEKGREKGLERGLEKGMEKGQNMVFELLDQGYTPEQIRARLRAVKREQQ